MDVPAFEILGPAYHEQTVFPFLCQRSHAPWCVLVEINPGTFTINKDPMLSDLQTFGPPHQQILRPARFFWLSIGNNETQSPLLGCVLFKGSCMNTF